VGGGGGGYGDPLERAPEAVAGDVVNGLVSQAAARNRYGVVIDGERGVDRDATGREQATLKTQRQSLARNPTRRFQPEGGTGAEKLGARINEYLTMAHGPEGPTIRCRCGLTLCAASEHYKEYLAVREIVGHTGVGTPDGTESAPSFSLKEFYCPRCWTLVETEVFVAQTEA
jgi:N-methylhydantoinase B